MYSPSSFDSADSEALSFLANVARYSMTSGKSEKTSGKTHITLPYELESSVHMSSTSETGDETSSDAPAVSAGSVAIPDCASTRCNTPEATAGSNAALPRLSQVSSVHFFGVDIPPLYKLSAKEVAVRVNIAANAKLLLHELTGYEVDDIIDLLYVNETWFSTEVLIYALCLVNRLTFRYPKWYAPRAEGNSGDASIADSPGHSSYRSSAQNSHPVIPHVCSSTSSDASHIDNDEVRVSDDPTELKDHSHISSASSPGEVFNRHNTRRRVMALLLISGKFHGDVVYKTSSLANALNKFRNEKCAAAALAASTATAPSQSMASRPPPRIAPAHLGQCEKRLFQELGCTVFVHREEYQHCEDIVFRGA